MRISDCSSDVCSSDLNAYLTLANAFTLQYNTATSEQDMGLPLRLTANFNEMSERSSVEETYMQIESDAVAASKLLPDIAEHPMRPSKSAAFALLSRLYLSMTNYEGRSEEHTSELQSLMRISYAVLCLKKKT